MAPSLEGLKGSQEFFIMDIVIQLSRSECVRVEGNGMNFTVLSSCEQDSTKGIVWGICLYDEQSARSILSEDQSCNEGSLQRVKCLLAGIKPGLKCIFIIEISKKNYNIKIK